MAHGVDRPAILPYGQKYRHRKKASDVHDARRIIQVLRREMVCFHSPMTCVKD